MSRPESAAAPRLALLLDPRALALAILAYGVARAATLSITHDEALTYLLHVRASWAEVLSHSAPLASNNHLLNTALAKALLAFLPPTELVLRLPALAGLALFLWAAARLSRLLSGARRRTVAFLLLAVNPFVIDLLTISRGYALALGLTLAAAAILLGGAPAPRLSPAFTRSVLAAVAAGLAVTANLSFLHAFGAIAVVASWRLLLVAEGSRGRRLAVAAAGMVPFAFVLVALRLIYTPAVVARIRQIVATWGGPNGVWADTVPSLVERTLYGAPWFFGAQALWARALTGAVAVALLAAVVAAMVGTERRHPGTGLTPLLHASLLFVAVWMAEVALAHRLFNAPYPFERAASALIPFLTLAMVALRGDGGGPRPAGLRRAGALAATACEAAVLLHFLACINLSSTYIWRRDAPTRHVMTVVRAAATSTTAAVPLRLAVSWYHEPAANFYRITWDLAGVAPVTRETPRSGYDLYYLEEADWQAAGALRLRECRWLGDPPSVLAVPAGVECPSP